MKVEGMKRFRVYESEITDSLFGEMNEGICLKCGERQGGVEPDARYIKCEGCGAIEVMGLEEALIENRIVVVKDESLY